MHTPAHVAASLLLWRRESSWSATGAIVLGAALPDLPMFGFYVVQKLAGSSERDIWSQHYFDESWQLFFDVFNSIPLMLLILVVCRWRRYRWPELLAASALLHLACDLPLHHDDAHRHFLPFTHWRWFSPISYWDPRHYGRLFAVLELVFAIGSLSFLVARNEHRPIRWVAALMLGVYGLAVGGLVLWALSLIAVIS